MNLKQAFRLRESIKNLISSAAGIMSAQDFEEYDIMKLMRSADYLLSSKTKLDTGIAIAKNSIHINDQYYCYDCLLEMSADCRQFNISSSDKDISEYCKKIILLADELNDTAEAALFSTELPTEYVPNIPPGATFQDIYDNIDALRQITVTAKDVENH